MTARPRPRRIDDPASFSPLSSLATRDSKLNVGYSPLSRLNVLIIDPDERYAQQLSALADETGVGIAFRHVPDFSKAKKWLKAGRALPKAADTPDAIILGLEGEILQQALAAIKPSGAGCPDTPVVVLTRNPGEDGGQRAVDAGAQDVLIKGKSDIHRIALALRFAIIRHRMVLECQATEQMAQKIKNILSDLIAHSRDGIMIVSESGNVHLANENALRLMGGGESKFDAVDTPIDPAKLGLDLRPPPGASHVDVHLAATRWGDDRSTIVFLRETK